MCKIHIYHFALTSFPSKKAHGRQVFEMANSLSKISQYKLISNGVKIKYPERIYDFYQVNNLTFDFIPLIDDLKFENYPLIRKVFYFLRLLLNIIFLIKIVKKRKNFYSREWWPSIFLSIFKRKVICEIHQINTYQLSINSIKLGLKILKIFGKFSNLKIIFISNNLKKKFDKIIYFPEERKIILGSAYRNLKEKRVKEEIKSFDAIYSGSLQKSKGIENFIKLSLLNKNKSFCIIGGKKKEIKEYQANLNCKNIKNLKFISFVEPTLLKTYLQRAKILIIPQIDDTAESPMKLYEYLNLEKPILASKTKPIQEVLKNNINAVLYRSNSIHDMNLQFRRLNRDLNLKMKISKSAKILSKSHTWDIRAEKILSEFKTF